MDFAEQKAKFENIEAATGGVLQNLTKFAGKHLSRRFLFNKVPGLRLATLLKKDSDTGIFL